MSRGASPESATTHTTRRSNRLLNLHRTIRRETQQKQLVENLRKSKARDNMIATQDMRLNKLQESSLSAEDYNDMKNLIMTTDDVFLSNMSPQKVSPITTLSRSRGQSRIIKKSLSRPQTSAESYGIRRTENKRTTRQRRNEKLKAERTHKQTSKLSNPFSKGGIVTRSKSRISSMLPPAVKTKKFLKFDGM